MTASPIAAPIAADREAMARVRLALRAAEDAGAVLMRHFGHLERVEHKAAVDLVTAADRDSERTVLAELHLAFPHDVAIGEERDGGRGRHELAAAAAAAPWAWVIDPLDGTTNFAHGYLQFAVSIGLLRWGRPFAGVVLAPARRELYLGGVGLPATCNGQPIAVRGGVGLADALLATGFPYDRRARIDLLLARLRAALLVCHGIRRGGSAALDLCEVAAGRLDGYWEDGLHAWDVAAGQAIVAAAGGVVMDFGGAPADPFVGEVVAGGDGAIAPLCALLRDAR